jgi:hypothetical protein
MTQELAGLRQGCAGPQELRCRGVAQAMRMDAPETRAPGGIRHDGAYTARPKRVMRREVPDEHGPALGVCGSCAFQVFGHPVTDIRRKRQPFHTASLAGHDHRASTPVDIVQRQPDNLTAPKTEPDQQGQDRQVAAADGCAAIAGREKAPHLIGLEPLGQPGQPATQDRRHGRDKRPFRDAVQIVSPLIVDDAHVLSRAGGRRQDIGFMFVLDDRRRRIRSGQPCLDGGELVRRLPAGAGELGDDFRQRDVFAQRVSGAGEKSAADDADGDNDLAKVDQLGFQLCPCGGLSFLRHARLPMAPLRSAGDRLIGGAPALGRPHPHGLEQPPDRERTGYADAGEDRAQCQSIADPRRQAEPRKDDQLRQHGDAVADDHVRDRLDERHEPGLLQAEFLGRPMGPPHRGSRSAGLDVEPIGNFGDDDA